MTFDGKLMNELYSLNDRDAKPRIFEMDDTGDTLKIVKEFTGKDFYIIITLDEWDSQSNSYFYSSKERCMNIRWKWCALMVLCIGLSSYADGTFYHWNKLGRPGVVLENGDVVVLSLSALDVPKEQEKGNDTHGRKIIVIPFDGEAMGRYLHNHSNPVQPGETSPKNQ